jgi:small subunit ribosomal protein S19
MTRSRKKGPYIDSFFLKKKNYKNSNFFTCWSRSSTILPVHIGKNVQVHAGNRFLKFRIIEDMIGHKFGEFAITRKKPIHKKKDN